jgi:proline iminopeptidase
MVGHGQGEFVDSKNGRIYVEREGSGPPLLLIPGGPGGSHSSLHPWLSSFAATHEVIYYDPIGTGRSDGLENHDGYTVELNAEGIEAVRQHFGYDKISLMGFSFGGMPLLAYLTNHAARVSSAVMCGAQVNASTWQTGNIDHINQRLQRHYPERWQQLLALRAAGIRSTHDDYMELLDPAEDSVLWYERDDKKRPVRYSDTTEQYRPEVYEIMCGGDPDWILGGTMAEFDPLPKLAGLSVPILICLGRWDGKLTVDIAEAISKQLNAELHVFEQSGHFPHVEQPEEFLRAVSAFLQRNP